MMAVRFMDESDSAAYWADVVRLLVDLADLSEPDAHCLVAAYCARLACQSPFGRLLVYHQSVPDAAYEVWRAGNNGAIDPDFQERLNQSYARQQPNAA